MSLFKNYRYQDSIMIIPYSIGVVAIVYIICTMIDLVRKNQFEKRYMRIIDKYSVSWLKIFREIYNFLKGKFLVKRKAVEDERKMKYQLFSSRFRLIRSNLRARSKKIRKDSSCSRQATEYCWKCLHRENRRY